MSCVCGSVCKGVILVLVIYVGCLNCVVFFWVLSGGYV